MADNTSTEVNEDQLDDSLVDSADDISWDDASDEEESDDSSEEELAANPEDAEKSVDDSKSEDETEDGESEEEAEEEQTDPADVDPKEHNRAMYEQRQQEKAAREARIRDAQAEYVAEAAGSEDPLATAVRQLQVDAYNNTVRNNETTLSTEYQRALVDFEVLRSEDPSIIAEVNAALDAFQAQAVTIDQYGNPTEVRDSLYKTLQAKADSITRLTGIREQRQTDSKAKQKSKSITPPSRTAREAKVDADLAAFDEEAGL